MFFKITPILRVIHPSRDSGQRLSPKKIETDVAKKYDFNLYVMLTV